MTEPIYCAFYTFDSIYEQEVKRLRGSLDALGLPHHLEGMVSLGNWASNARHTATFICRMLQTYSDRPVVYLDADAYVWRMPKLFDVVLARDFDLAVHWIREKSFANGTMFFSPTPGALEVASRYRALVADNPRQHNEQIFMERAIEQMDGKLRIFRLPSEYLWIHDISPALPDGMHPVIEHLQASRENCSSPALPARRKRVEFIEQQCTSRPS